MRIGVFDSGIGGLSVLKPLLEARFFDEVVYYGDTARVPYGVKDKETIVRFSLEALEFFEPFNLDMLIIACNTVSAYALKELRARTKMPIFGVIDAGVSAVSRTLQNKNDEILIIATQATIKSKRYQNRLEKLGFSHIKALATGLFVPMVEEGIFEGKVVESAFEYYFSSLQSKPKALILGCTHFPLLAKPLQEYFGEDTLLIHSGQALADQLERKFQLKRKNKKTKVSYYASSDIKKLKEKARIWLKR
ncbi:glutamate racemase [Campylobacter sp. MIT 12-8780]|uniref:glutamate racemase n=1 Tax=unclassified Campylobacter TaxID=2593542 RepID=UPI00115D4246|nr:MULTISPECIES: glutamate racemase [unclassified Campylobacter]NDJ27231.1 glutamate racemase [Campylobacter sp. MIT 19-121]TQR41477.1 glutamate racemase [Campylobacter sp. MIT 12-8780]